MMMTYMPRLAPAIGMMARDLYGIDYSDWNQLQRVWHDGRIRPEFPEWIAAWEPRGRAEWQSLRQKYGFRLVLSPTTTPLDLPVALPGPLWTLYIIP